MSSITLSRAQNLGATAPRGAGFGMGLVLLAQLMFVLDSAVVNVALPNMQSDLGFSTAGLSWVLNAYMLAFGGLLLLGGRLGDVFGRLTTFWWGLAVFTVFSLVGGLAQSPDMLVISRALQGVGAAIASPSVLALLTTNAKDEHARHRALAMFATVASSGVAIGLILGGVLTDALSWRWTMFINVPIGLVVLTFVRRLVADTPRRDDRFDVVGAITATGGAAAIVWAVTEAPDYGWGSARVLAGFVVGALLLAALAVTETRVSHPLLRPALLRNRRRVAVLVGSAAYFGVIMGTFFILVQFFRDQLGYGPLTSGLAFLPMPVTIFLLSRVIPRLVARFGRLPFLLGSPVVAIVSLLLLTQLDGASPYFWAIVVPLELLGLANGVLFMPMMSIALEDVPHEHAGSASGLLQTMQQLGGSIGLAIVASAFSSHAAHGGIAAGLAPGFRMAAVLALITLVSTLTLAVRRSPALAPSLD